ncbi:hypothetical protein Y1Q_0002711 [Alligator mississippiensis]|uniref:Uncharacterized protein n=1 Tax=Alligator mississippiensis TaxID=8496 RepID=A0A151NYW0_ALLMI|nr:hypothetical protein Y1Q_0002711 [Alligator mississippiensis]
MKSVDIAPTALSWRHCNCGRYHLKLCQRTPQIDGAGLALPQTRSEFYPLKCAEVSAIRQEVRTCVESLCPCSGRFQPRAEGQYRKYGCLKLLMSYFDQLRIDDSPCLFLLCWKT